MLKRLSIDFVEMDFTEVVLLAERYGLTAYDASYLWLARQLAELVTLDQDLEKACSTGRI